MRRRTRWLFAGLIAGLLASGLLTAALRYYPAYRAALEARAELREVQALLEAGRLDTSEAQLQAAEAKLDDVERDFRRLAGRIDEPPLQLARHLPLIGEPVGAVDELTAIAVDGVQVGRDAIEVTRTYQRLRAETSGSLTEQTDVMLAALERPMSDLQEGLRRIQHRRARLTGATLPPALADAIEEVDRELVQLEALQRTYEDLSAFLPEFLGFEEPKTYLFLAQNNAELMPTGGLISVYGVITVDQGRITHQKFADAVRFGGQWLERTGAYVAPPAPLRRYLLREMSWNLAVANWSPHFPEAASQAERFFRLAGGRPVDGVIGINVHTIEALLTVTGPITVPSYGVTVTPENALEVIEQHTRSAREPSGDRKAFVGLLADELLSRIAHLPPERWTPLLDALQRLRDERQVLLFFHEPTLQRLAERLGLAGELVRTDGDYLLLVDASVNSTKLNMVLDQTVDVRVRLDAAGTVTHQVTSRYQNNLPAWAAGRDPELVRRLMLGGVYGGYLRLFTPAGSTLESVTIDEREVGPEEVGWAHGKTVFGRFFALPSGATTAVSFSYSTPELVRLDEDTFEYRFYLQKQSGTDAIPLRLHVVLPEDAEVASATLDGAPLAGLDAITTNLERDRELVVRYTLN